ncbi:MAG: S41 family peptidase [Phycisphaerales bacterium]
MLRMRPIVIAAVVFVLSAVLPGFSMARAQSPGGAGERSPFTDIRFVGPDERDAEILVGGTWYRWVSIDGIAYERIAEAARQRHTNNWRMRLGEDLVHVLGLVGHSPGPGVTLVVASLAGGELRTLEGVPMTGQQRSIVRDLRAQRDAMLRLVAAHSERERMIERHAGILDGSAVFDELVAVIEREHAYAHLRGLDLRGEAAREIERLGERPTWADGLLAAQRFVSRLGDGHASVRDWLEHGVPDGRLGFLLGQAEGGIVAFRGDRSGFVDERHPFVERLDGRPIQDWIDAASVYVAAGSEQLVRRRSIELLRYVNLVRDELGLPRHPAVEVDMRSADGASMVRVAMPLRDERQMYGVWPRHESGVLPSGFGYLRIEQMSLDRGGSSGGSVASQLEPLMGTPGLVIDVRGNGGGSRDVVEFLLQRLLQPGEARVVCVAARRIPTVIDPAHPDGFLQDRDMYPAAWSGWSEAERRAIERVAAAWRPEWTPPGGWDEGFSDWHYYVVSGVVSGRAVRYEGPVVVLMDDGCFSATDILLGGLKGIEGVTLMGTASSGGSANADDHRLGTLGLDAEVRLATMASFLPDGRAYDGNGVEPDVVVPRVATDLIGRADSQLEAAVGVLEKVVAGRR